MGLRASLFALVYDRLSRRSEDAGLGAMREQLLASAAGRVLEIGAGTGTNFAHYDEKLESLVVTEPEPAMLRRLRRKARAEMPAAEVVQAAAEELPFEDDSFDTVVSTLVLCGVGDQARALREAHRVLRPGGRLLFIEHVRSEEPSLGRLQDRITPLHRLVLGCDLNRRTLAAIETAGFTISAAEQTALPEAPKFVRPAVVGVAVADG